MCSTTIGGPNTNSNAAVIINITNSTPVEDGSREREAFCKEAQDDNKEVETEKNNKSYMLPVTLMKDYLSPTTIKSKFEGVRRSRLQGGGGGTGGVGGDGKGGGGGDRDMINKSAEKTSVKNDSNGVFLGDEASLYGVPRESLIEFADELDADANHSFIQTHFLSIFQPTDNKLAMKLFGSKKALMNEKMRQKAAGQWIIHPLSNFR